MSASLQPPNFLLVLCDPGSTASFKTILAFKVVIELFSDPQRSRCRPSLRFKGPGDNRIGTLVVETEDDKWVFKVRAQAPNLFALIKQQVGLTERALTVVQHCRTCEIVLPGHSGWCCRAVAPQSTPLQLLKLSRRLCDAMARTR